MAVIKQYMFQAGYAYWPTQSSAPTASTTPYGWVVAKLAPTRYSNMEWLVERASGTFGTTPLPDVPSVQAQFIVATNVLTGDFQAGTWTVSVPVIADSAGGAQDGRIRARIFKNSGSSSFTNIVELTSSTLVGTDVTNLTNTVEQVSSVSVSLGATSMVSQIILVAIAWEITGAGTSNSADVLLRIGSTGYVQTANFVSTLSASGSVGTVNVSAPEASVQLLTADRWTRRLLGVGK